MLIENLDGLTISQPLLLIKRQDFLIFYGPR